MKQGLQMFQWQHVQEAKQWADEVPQVQTLQTCHLTKMILFSPPVKEFAEWPCGETTPEHSEARRMSASQLRWSPTAVDFTRHQLSHVTNFRRQGRQAEFRLTTEVNISPYAGTPVPA